MSEVANNHPEFQSAEAAAKLDAVVHAVADGLGFARFEIFGDEREGTAQDVHAARVEHGEIKGREEPFVRIRDE